MYKTHFGFSMIKLNAKFQANVAHCRIAKCTNTIERTRLTYYNLARDGKYKLKFIFNINKMRYYIANHKQTQRKETVLKAISTRY